MAKKHRKGRNNAERMRDEGSNDKTKKSSERGGKQILRYAQNDGAKKTKRAMCVENKKSSLDVGAVKRRTD